MTMSLLRQIASTPSPTSFHRPQDIEAVKGLRAAGMIIALIPSPNGLLSMSGPAETAQVLALTQQGREELSKGALQALASRPKDSGIPRRVRG